MKKLIDEKRKNKKNKITKKIIKTANILKNITKNANLVSFK